MQGFLRLYNARLSLIRFSFVTTIVVPRLLFLPTSSEPHPARAAAAVDSLHNQSTLLSKVNNNTLVVYPLLHSPPY